MGDRLAGGMDDEDGFVNSYCNTVPTPEGGTHETGLRAGLSRSLKAYGELVGNRKAAQITAEDIIGGALVMLLRSSSAIRSSRARPRKSWRPPRPPAWSKPRSRITSITGCRATRAAPRTCSSA